METATSDCWIDGPEGRIFARRWSPAGEAAAGVPVVLLHDSLGCVALWRDFPAALSAVTGRQVVAYDRPGFGRSDARTTRPSLDFIAEEATRYFPVVRAALGIDRFAVVGHSVGGGMACHVAAAAPHACEALATLSAQAFVEARTRAGIEAAKARFDDPAEVERLARYHGPKAAWVVDAWTGCWLDPAFGDWSLAPVLPRVACPVLALHGERDEYGSDRHPAAIAHGVGGPARFEILRDVGHVPHREQPERVVARLAAFLAARPGRP